MQAVSYGARSRQYSPLLPASSSQPRSIFERPRSGPMGRVHIYTTIQAYYKRPRHAWKMASVASLLRPCLIVNTPCPRLARSTLNELQQKQHEKASLVCVREQSPSELALAPCALSMVDLSGQLRCWITQTSLVQKNVFIFIFGTLCSYDPLWRVFFA